MKNKRLVIVIIILVILVISSIIIFFREDYSKVNVKTIDIMDNICETLDEDIPNMIDLTEEELKNNYNIDVDKIEEYVVKMPIMNVRANEIAIIKVKNIRDIGYIKDKVNDRIKNIQDSFDGYLQDQLVIAKSPLIIVKGRYVLMSISESNDTIESIFNSYFINNK
ncbi:MAG: hypothetical protein K0R72_1009 [Clostridia bacterium]|jgi:hypothetical protein|nr:hypothetical protein [Clostridia bacterium]